MFSRILSDSGKRKLLIAFQWLIPVLSIYFIWLILESKIGNSALMNVWMHAFDAFNLLYMIPVMIVLSVINLLIEAGKWMHAFKSAITISFSESVRQTFLSIAAGFITPLKSGALLARIIANDKADAFTIFNATLKMAIAQFTITFFAGMTGLIFLLWNMELEKWAILAGVFTICAFGLLILYPSLSISFHYKDRKWDGISFDLKLILLSGIRYFVFSFQYILLLDFFGVEADVLILISLVSVTYLVNSLIPSGALGKLGVRELSGILIIGEFTGFIAETSCAAFCIWVLNQAIPSLVGSGLFVWRNIHR